MKVHWPLLLLSAINIIRNEELDLINNKELVILWQVGSLISYRCIGPLNRQTFRGQVVTKVIVWLKWSSHQDAEFWQGSVSVGV